MRLPSETARDWVPDACTLPTVEQPLRLADFDDLLSDSVSAVRRLEPLRLQLVLRREPAVVAHAAELAARESQCCSFFTFTLTIAADAAHIDVSVPVAHADVLDGLTARAEQLSARAGRE